MRHRQYTVEPIRWSQRAYLGCASGDEQEILVGEHHTLGNARGARCIDQSSDIATTVFFERFRSSRFVKSAHADHSQSFDLLDHRSMPLGVLGGSRRDARGVEHSPGAAMIANFVDF